MAVTDIERWQARIQASETSLLTPAVKAAAEFLISARIDEHGWGPYRSMPFDLYSSSLAVEALRSCGQEEFEPVIRSSVLALVEEVAKGLAGFNVQESIAAVRLLAGVRSQTEDVSNLRAQAVERLESMRNGFGWGEPKPSIPITAEALFVLAGSVDDDKLELWKDGLGQEQNRDGGWPVTPGGETSLMASARVALVLAGALPERKSHKALREYLRSNAGRFWDEQAGPNADPYVVAVVLDACARFDRVNEGLDLDSLSYETILRGIDALMGCRNDDGAWGERKGGISNVEATSMAIHALCSAGLNRLVPARLAAASVDMAGARIAELDKQLDQMQQDVKARAGREVKSILKQNDSLNQRVSELENERRVLTKQLEESQLQRERAERLAGYFSPATSRLSPPFRTLGIWFWFWPYLTTALTAGGYLVGKYKVLPYEPILLFMFLVLETFLGLQAVEWFSRRLRLPRPFSPGTFSLRFFLVGDPVRNLLTAIVVGLGSLLGKYAAAPLLGRVPNLVLLLSATFVLALLVNWLSGRSSGIGLREGGFVGMAIPDADRDVVVRRLREISSRWPASLREGFTFQLSGVGSTESRYQRESIARAIALEFASDRSDSEDLRSALSLFLSLSANDQGFVLQRLRGKDRVPASS